MTVYLNPRARKVRGSHLLLISCARCSHPIATYRKVGESNLVKMFSDRIVDGTVDFSLDPGAVFCPGCQMRVATRYTTRAEEKTAYRLVPSAFHRRKVNAPLSD